MTGHHRCSAHNTTASAGRRLCPRLHHPVADRDVHLPRDRERCAPFGAATHRSAVDDRPG